MRFKHVISTTAACVVMLAGCSEKPEDGQGRSDFGTGQGRVYDRGGLDPDLGSVSVGRGGAHPNTNTSVKGTPAN